MKYLFLLAFSSILFLTYKSSQAQITVLNYNSDTCTHYKNDSVFGKDSIYIIYTPHTSGVTIERATLRASFNNEDSLNFKWYFINGSTKQYELIHSIDSVRSSDYTNAVEGGYRVHIENSKKGIDTSFVAWVFIETFKVDETIEVLVSACDKMILQADTTFENKFVYYDLDDFSPIVFNNDLKGNWRAEPALAVDDSTTLKPTFDPPVELTKFTFEATDNFKYKRSRWLTIDEESIDENDDPYLRAVKANFKGVSGQDTEPRDTSVKVEAPYGVSYINDSKNGSNYEWHFYNHPRWMNSNADSLIGYSDLFQPIDSIYYLHPVSEKDPILGYDVKLFVYGPVFNDSLQCLDTIRKINFVLVDPTQFPDSLGQLPNVFNPDSKNPKNRTFYFLDDDNMKPVSVKYFSIKIYNRWGNKVYEFEDNDASWFDDGHYGWDGQTRFGGMARPGVYYYVIFATGWDDRSFEVPGFVHIVYQK